MKHVFVGILGLLVLASLATRRSMTESRSPLPVIYWVTDANPARLEQINLFHRWQIKQGHVHTVVLRSLEEVEALRADLPVSVWDDIVATQPDASAVFAGALAGATAGRFSGLTSAFLDARPQVRAHLQSPLDASRLALPIELRLPQCEMRLDTASTDISKRIIQGVSGVAGEVWDAWNGQYLRPIQEIGLARDVTDDARRLGFEHTRTWPTLAGELCVPDEHGRLRQYMFPCNVEAGLMIINVETFERLGQPLPPKRWTIEQFERLGRAFVERANREPGQRRRVFYASDVQWWVLQRSYGGSMLNETLSASALDSAENAAALRKLRQWTHVDRLIPTAADRAAATSESSFGGVEPQMLNQGVYGMMPSGRWRLITFRQFNIARARAGLAPLRLTVSEQPHAIMPNTVMGTRAAMIYAGSRHADLAVLFQAYLASEDYNQQIVDDADALPPIPAYTQTEAFRRPPVDPARGIHAETEWDFHEHFATMGTAIGIGGEYSPFINWTRAQSEEQKAIDEVINDIRGVEEALALAASRTEQEIRVNLRENPRLVPLRQALLERQRRIDEKKQAILAYRRAHPDRPVPEAMKIPLEWIDNPVLRRFHQTTGMAGGAGG